MDNKNWKLISGYDCYFVSECGQVKSLKKGREKIRTLSIVNSRYIVPLLKDGKYFNATVHRLVAEAFLPNPLNLDQVNHINGDKLDNRSGNLEWCTRSHNIKHAIDNGYIKHKKGEDHGMNILSEVDVLKIRALKKSGLKYRELKEIYNVSIGCLSSIVNRYTWKNLI